MVQSGIAYAAGQLLAVVAPRTVLVVDAPTDWSLAGPLWELALDDAPVDEILDVLIRRGIRTAPSFAIVRVENDAVRALVRGSVPVCFERVGEPVRLDATGATTWLEGLISSARRVLVGAVETNTTLPFLVSTGVVLVSGLALPCGPSDPGGRGSSAPGTSQQSGEPNGSGSNGNGGPPEESPSYFSRPAAAPVAVAGREPRVVDLTRSGGRAQAKAYAASAPERSEMNGHAPAAIEASPIQASPPKPEPIALDPLDSSTPLESITNYQPEPIREPEPEPIREPEPEPEPIAFQAEPIALPAEPEPEPEPQPKPKPEPVQVLDLAPFPPRPIVDDWVPPRSAPQRPAPPRPVDDPGELHDLDDDLLVNSAEEPAPRGPSPVDLPNFDPPSLSLPKLNGLGVPAQPRGFGGAPAVWPPAPVDASNAFSDSQYDSQYDGQANVEADSPTPNAPNSEPGQPSVGDLPLRIKGRSLRPEQREPLNGSRLSAVPPLPAEAPVADGETPGSGNLLLPAFFKGAKAARKPEETPPEGLNPISRKVTDDDAEASDPWAPSKPKSSAPVAWVPPVRRGGPDRSGFNGGPPSMPGVLRTSGGDDAFAEDGNGSRFAQPAEVSAAPEMPSGPMGINQNPDGPREPPRLLGVWCDAGHVTSPDHQECRVCGLAVPPQAPILVARPPLGVLIFDNGDRVMVDRPVVLGRDPKPTTASPDPEAPVLHAVPSATGQVSRTHAEIRASGWDVVLTDLDAMNGTALTLPGASPVAIEPSVPTVITPGTRIDLGGESGFVFEVEG